MEGRKKWINSIPDVYKRQGLDIVGNDIIKFLETSPNTFFLATRKKLYKIKGNRAECLLQFSNTKEQNNITSRCV